jgi:hypothetical protein
VDGQDTPCAADLDGRVAFLSKDFGKKGDAADAGLKRPGQSRQMFGYVWPPLYGLGRQRIEAGRMCMANSKFVSILARVAILVGSGCARSGRPVSASVGDHCPARRSELEAAIQETFER